MKENEAISYLTKLGYEVIKPLTGSKRPLHRLGMYGELDKVVIGDMELCMMSDKEGEDHVWIQIIDEEGCEFYGKPLKELGEFIKKWFNDNF